MRKIPGSPHFSVLQATKTGRGLGTRLLFHFRVASVLDEESLSLLAFVCSQHIAGHTEGWVLTKFDIHCVCSTTIYVVPQGQVTLWWAYIKEWCHLCTCVPYWGKPKASISTVNSLSLSYLSLARQGLGSTMNGREGSIRRRIFVNPTVGLQCKSREPNYCLSQEVL